MQFLLYAVCAVVSYLIGGINPAIVLSNLIYRQDIRTLGSGNPGFTNFKRVFGGRYAWFVFVLDILKAVVVCLLSGLAFRERIGSYQLGAAYAGFFAMLGHCFPVWYGFQGGKAFLVGAGAIWCLDYRAGIVSACIMLLLLFTLHYMSLASVCSGLTCPITLLLLGKPNPYVLLLSTLSALLMVWRHRENIRRLVKRTEAKTYLFSKPPVQSVPGKNNTDS